MKKIKTALIALSCLFLVGGGLTACNSEEPTPIVTITNGESATLEVGETLQLNVTLEHSDEDIIYTSSNTSVATVNDTGLITAVAKGEATITAKAGDITDTIKVTVTDTDVPPTPTPTVTITNGETAEMKTGDTLQLNVVTKDVEGSVEWSSSDTTKATVNANGLVTAVAKGEVTITAAVGEVKDTIKITITDSSPVVVEVESVTLNKTEITLDVGGTETLTATVLPENATDKTVTWETSDAKVATVANGVVTAVAKGEATVTAKAGEKSATCKVIVNEVDYSIGQITAANKVYTVRGEVVAENTQALLISDGTDSIYLFDRDLPSNYAIGDYVEATGSVTSYNKAFQMAWNATTPVSVTKLSGESGITIPDPTPLTAEIANSWKTTSAFTTSDIKEYSWKAVAGTYNGYDILNIDGSDVNIEPVYTPSNWNIVSGQAYDVTAYFIGYYGYASIILTGLEETTIPVESINLSADKTEVTAGEIVTLTTTLSPSGAEGDVSYAITEGSDLATLEGNKLTTKAAGTVKVQASVGEVKSNEVTIVINAATDHGSINYDWTKGWDNLTCTTNQLGALAASMTDFIVKANQTGDAAKKLFNDMTPNQTEITSASFTGQMYFPKDYSKNAGFLVGPVNNQVINFPDGNDSMRAVWKFTTLHQIKKISFDIIPASNAQVLNFDLNDQTINLTRKDTWDGTIANKETVIINFDQATNDFTFSIGWLQNNQMAIVGMDFEW